VSCSSECSDVADARDPLVIGRPAPRRRVGRCACAVGLLLATAVSACIGGQTTTPPATPPTPPAATGSPEPLPSTVTTTPGPQHRLRLALGREPVSLDPAEVREDAGRLVVDAVFDSLTRMSSNLAVAQPAAAEDWSASDDLRTWTFSLRADATWHDGAPVVAADFVRAIERLSPRAETRAFNAFLVEPLVHPDGRLRVRAVDDLTIEVVAPRPMADLPTLLSHPALAPRRADEFNQEEPVGNGPFAVAEPWAHNQFVRLAPATGATESVPLDEVLLPIYAQRSTEEVQYADFRTGALDVAALPIDDVRAARDLFGQASGSQGVGVVSIDLATIHYLGFDTTSAPWEDADVRRAVSLLVDRDVLVAQVGQEARTAAEGIVPPGLPGAGVATCDHCDRDLVTSLALLAQAPAPPSSTVRLLAPDDPASTRVATVVASSIEDGLDVPVRVDTRPLGEYASALADRDFDLFLGAWTASRPSMGGVLEPMLGSSSGRLDNPGRIDDPEVDQALARAASSASATARVRAWQAAEQAALDQALVAPLYVPRARVVVADDVTGFRLRPDGEIDLASLDVAPDE